MKQLQDKKKTLRWIDITKPTQQDRDAIKNEFDLLRIDLSDAFRSTYRSKISHRENYIFLVLMVPIFRYETQSIDIEEIDLFIGKDYVISVHQGNLKPLKSLIKTALNNGNKKEELLGRGVEHFAHELLNGLLSYTYPMVDEIDNVLEKLKIDIFADKKSRRILVKDILLIRGNVAELRKAIRGHVTVIGQLIKRDNDPNAFDFITQPALFESLVDDAEEIWAALESNKELIEALEDANESLVSHSLNEVMKTLTVFSAIMLPSVVVASIFGMNVRYAPLLGHELGFWILLMFMGLVTLIMLFVFWRKHWLK
ncbi:MAG: magnesium transporter CorA family protein [Candidatus Kerfeldbacteria bacterium]